MILNIGTSKACVVFPMIRKFEHVGFDHLAMCSKWTNKRKSCYLGFTIYCNDPKNMTSKTCPDLNKLILPPGYVFKKGTDRMANNVDPEYLKINLIWVFTIYCNGPNNLDKPKGSICCNHPKVWTSWVYQLVVIASLYR